MAIGKSLFNAGVQLSPDTLYAKYTDKKAVRDDFANAFRGTGSTTPLNQFQSSDNTRYARDFVGWDKAQANRRAAEAADDPAALPPGKGHFDRRYNHVTGEMEWVQRDPGNFWRANKDELIQMGGFLAGGLIGAPMLGYSLAKTARDVYKMRDARRDFRDDKRDWENQQRLDAEREASYGPHGGNLFKNAGEGVVEWATKDIERNKRKGTYERGAV